MVLNKLFIVIRAKSSKDHTDARDFRIGLEFEPSLREMEVYMLRFPLQTTYVKQMNLCWISVKMVVQRFIHCYWQL